MIIKNLIIRKKKVYNLILFYLRQNYILLIFICESELCQDYRISLATTIHSNNIASKNS